MAKKKPLKKSTSDGCYCGANLAYQACCQPLHLGEAKASTAEQLMRSRYSAFCALQKDYLLATWQPQHRPAALDFDDQQQWLGLKIVNTEAGQVNDDTGVVEFVARYKIGGKAYRLHEVSQFERLDGAWVYTTGESGIQ